MSNNDGSIISGSDTGFRHRLRRLRAWFGNAGGKQQGFSLVEVLIAVSILGGVALLLVGSLYSGTVAVGTMQQQNTAENLARSQLEYTKSVTYQNAPFTYTSITDVPDGYSVTSQASAVSGKDTNLQKITITVYRDAESVYVLEGYKVNR